MGARGHSRGSAHGRGRDDALQATASNVVQLLPPGDSEEHDSEEDDTDLRPGVGPNARTGHQPLRGDDRTSRAEDLAQDPQIRRRATRHQVESRHQHETGEDQADGLDPEIGSLALGVLPLHEPQSETDRTHDAEDAEQQVVHRFHVSPRGQGPSLVSCRIANKETYHKNTVLSTVFP